MSKEKAIKALREALNELENEGMETYRRGQRFRVRDNDYILASVDYNHMALICLSDGNRWHNPIFIEDNYAVTKTEMKELTNGKPFELIS